jgi:hypothetical protein
MPLMLHPEKWHGYFQNRSGSIFNLSEPTLLLRYLHFLGASISMGGLFMVLVAWWKMRKGFPAVESVINSGLKWFSWATIFQMIVGVGFLVSLAPGLRKPFMGGDSLYSVIFWASVTFSLLGQSSLLSRAGSLCAQVLHFLP